MLENLLNKWSDVHVFYNTFTHSLSRNKTRIVNDEFLWRNKIFQATHGRLLIENNFFKSLKQNSKIFLAHITPNLHNILEKNHLFPSSGCLVGSIYCTPIDLSDGKLRLHNLGEFIINHEMPKFLGKELIAKNQLGILVIRIDLPSQARNNLIGIDYLRLGELHLETYKNLEYLLSLGERHLLEDLCAERIRKASDFLSLCNRKYWLNENVDSVNFLDMMVKTTEYLPILGYFYFETLAEFLMLYQDCKEATNYDSIGEFWTPSHKRMVFSLFPQLPSNFSLRLFKPKFLDVVSYLKRYGFFTHFNTDEISKYLCDRLAFLINARFFKEDAKLIEWHKLEWKFDNLTQFFGPLLGHLIHRELRNFGRYPHFYFYFDQFKALQIWNYWNYMHIAIPFNGVFPKGEVGINPAYPDLRYRIYQGKPYEKNGYIYLEIGKELDIEIAPQLINLRFTTMRNKDMPSARANLLE